MKFLAQPQTLAFRDCAVVNSIRQRNVTQKGNYSILVQRVDQFSGYFDLVWQRLARNAHLPEWQCQICGTAW
jgi:hypothetical protein